MSPTTFSPTAEQAEALALFRSGESMVIEAGAGTGKTSTLRLLAESADGRLGQYLAFNKAIVTDVAKKLPAGCNASTAHSLAFRRVGRRFSHRLNAQRIRTSEVAEILGIGPMAITSALGRRKTLSPSLLAGHAMRAVVRFCQTADPEPSLRHFPLLEGLDEAGRFDNNQAIAEELFPTLALAWIDLTSPSGRLPYRHDHYLKLWQLSHPRIEVDYLLFDEAQDANPVMAAVVGEQEHAQRVYVGDSAQAIYEFTGAVNALDRIEEANRRMLTQSFRFGPAVAARANVYLDRLDAPLRLTGDPRVRSTVGKLAGEPDAWLTRTNAMAVETMLRARSEGHRPYLVGGGSEVVAFAQAAQKLMDGGRTYHPELACFESWMEVQEYVEQDAYGGELKLLVDLVDRFGVDTIVDALDRMPSQSSAFPTVSTAHKAKGREWETVKIAGDFVQFDPTDAELRLRYVAVTRGRQHVDDTALSIRAAAIVAAGDAES